MLKLEMEKYCKLEKNRLVKSGLITLLIFIQSSLLFGGGPWPQKKGVGYFKLSEWWINFDQHFTDSGLLDPNVTTGIYTTAFYGEYGLTDRFTVQAYVPFLTRNLMNNLVSATTNEVIVQGEAVNAMGDVDLMFKYALTKPGSKIPISATLILGIPTGKSVAGKQENLQTGDGEFNKMLQLDAGKGYAINQKIAGYTSIYAGFNNRTNGFSEEFRFGIESGVGFFNQRLWLTGRFFGIESLKNGATAATINSTSIFANNTEFTSYGFEAAYYVTKKLGASFSFASAFRGEIIAAAPSYSIGVFYDMGR